MPDDNGITLADARAQLAAWLAADAKVAEGQSYRINSNGVERWVTRADAVEIRKNIQYWESRVRGLSGGGPRVRGVTFLP